MRGSRAHFVSHAQQFQQQLQCCKADLVATRLTKEGSPSVKSVKIKRKEQEFRMDAATPYTGVSPSGEFFQVFSVNSTDMHTVLTIHKSHRRAGGDDTVMVRFTGKSGKWRAQLSTGGRTLHLGTYHTRKTAAVSGPFAIGIFAAAFC